MSSLKQKVLPAADSQQLDCDVLYAPKLSPDDLKKSLLSLPAAGKKRLVILRNGEKLQPAHKDLLTDFVQSDQAVTVLILEAQWTAGEKFVREMKKFFSVKECVLPEAENIFAVTRMLTSRRPADAVRILNEILESGAHPLQIMGGLVWFWGNKARPMIDRERFEKGLLFLQEADLNIKRSRLSPEYALEVLISKMSVLLSR